jgi:NADH-quinone oxidoreductase subunit J
MAQVIFWIFAVLAVIASLGVITLRSSVHSAVSLTGTLVCLAVLYILLGAEFVGVVQIIVYAGAIMVLFLFVVTLLSPGREEVDDRLPGQRWIAGLLAILLLVEAGFLLTSNILPASKDLAAASAAPCTGQGLCIGNAQLIGQTIFTSSYLWAFEVTTIALLVAVVGAIVLAKRRIVA